MVVGAGLRLGADSRERHPGLPPIFLGSLKLNLILSSEDSCTEVALKQAVQGERKQELWRKGATP